MPISNRTGRSGNLDKEVLNKFKELDSKQPQVEPPSGLFHYTTPEGLIGIVQTTKLWATNIKYLNDFSEVKYTYDLFREMTDRIIKSKDSQIVKTFLEQFRKELIPHEMIFDAYVFCLSENGDQLSQWREYANRGIGYAIGFKGAALKRGFHRVGMRLLKVIYERHKQMQLIERVIIDSCAFLEDIETKYKDRTQANILDCCDLLISALIPYTVQFKHHVFSEEREWRIVYIPFHDIKEHIKFRPSNKLIIPYIEFGIEKLPIYSLYQGPQADFDLTRKSLQILFLQNNYSDISISESEVPLRF